MDDWGELKVVIAKSLLVLMLLFVFCCPFANAVDVSKASEAANATVGAKAKGKVLVVFIYDPHCQFTCDKVRPAVREAQAKYASSVSYLEIDTGEEHEKDSKALAEKNGVLWFYNDNLKFVPVVGFFSPERKCIKYLTGPKTKSVYEAALAKAMKAK